MVAQEDNLPGNQPLTTRSIDFISSNNLLGTLDKTVPWHDY
jgi:hypothetical protein